jgi:acrylyl-CoA reductase (NADPH)
MSFRAVRILKNDGEGQTAQVQDLDESTLSDRGIAIDVEFSDVNFKDGMCIAGLYGFVTTFPVTAGIDIVGTVTASDDAGIAVGDLVTVNGWGVGSDFDGGFAQRARVDAAWVTLVPKGLDGFSAAAVGTAGYAAALAVLALQDHYVTPASGPVLVTGASGGAGSVAVALLAGLGYDVVASTGRPEEAGYLRSLGATAIIDRATLSDAPQGPLGAEQWAGAIDTVGSNTLANILATTRYGGTVAAFGLAQGIDLPVTVLPFITRTVTLAGIDSVRAPAPARVRAWQLLAETLDPGAITTMTRTIALDDAIQTSLDTLTGKVRGRVVVDVNA